MDLRERLKKIEKAIMELHSQCKQLETENKALREEKTHYQELIKRKEELINNLEEQNKITKLAEGLSEDRDRKELKVQIDDLIQEIDQCLKLVKK